MPSRCGTLLLLVACPVFATEITGTLPYTFTVQGDVATFQETFAVGTVNDPPGTTLTYTTSVAEDLVTSGPLRPGELLMTFIDGRGIEDPASLEWYATVNGTTVDIAGGNYPLRQLAVTLGTSAEFDFSLNIFVGYDQSTGGGSVIDNIIATFEFVEADGTTPVPLSLTPVATPEPATLGLLALGLAVFWKWKTHGRTLWLPVLTRKQRMLFWNQNSLISVK